MSTMRELLGRQIDAEQAHTTALIDLGSARRDLFSTVALGALFVASSGIYCAIHGVEWPWLALDGLWIASGIRAWRTARLMKRAYDEASRVAVDAFGDVADCAFRNEQAVMAALAERAEQDGVQ